MAFWKKKPREELPEDYWTNPYYREEEERKRRLDPNRSMFFTWICTPVGLLLGLWLGYRTENMFIGTAFGVVLGIMVGTKLDAKFPRKKE